MPVSGNPAFYNIVFDVERFVHTVTVVGNSDSNFRESLNWYVTVGLATVA